MKKTLVFTLAALAVFSSCKSLLPEKLDVVQLGIVPEDIIIPEASGEGGVRIIADRDYAVQLITGSEWLRVGVTQRDSLSFAYDANAGYRRSARIRISADGREDELLVKQEGLFHERVSLSEHNLNAPAVGASFSLRVLSNLPSDYFRVSASSGSTIEKLLLSENVLSFDVASTTNRDKRSYEVTVFYTDGWGERVSDSVTVVQEAYE